VRIFLSDGTLLIDSCWETYRLVLRLKPVDGSQEQHFRIASVPYLYADMKR